VAELRWLLQQREQSLEEAEVTCREAEAAIFNLESVKKDLESTKRDLESENTAHVAANAAALVETQSVQRDLKVAENSLRHTAALESDAKCRLYVSVRGSAHTLIESAQELSELKAQICRTLQECSSVHSCLRQMRADETLLNDKLEGLERERERKDASLNVLHTQIEGANASLGVVAREAEIRRCQQFVEQQREAKTHIQNTDTHQKQTHVPQSQDMHHLLQLPDSTHSHLLQLPDSTHSQKSAL